MSEKFSKVHYSLHGSSSCLEHWSGEGYIQLRLHMIDVGHKASSVNNYHHKLTRLVSIAVLLQCLLLCEALLTLDVVSITAYCAFPQTEGQSELVKCLPNVTHLSSKLVTCLPMEVHFLYYVYWE